ncbi:unnamed protein product, partial [Vitis vinifera]|uniref:Uncharacterized protein n=1 Tax=Vitis vinifera TaxID=29760 RepID=D7TGU8_VITVI
MKAFHSKRSLISEISPRLSFYNAAHPRRLGSFARNPAKFPDRTRFLVHNLLLGHSMEYGGFS